MAVAFAITLAWNGVFHILILYTVYTLIAQEENGWTTAFDLSSLKAVKGSRLQETQV
jgi:hypothetical protein